MVSDRAQKIHNMLQNPETWAPFCHGTSSKATDDINKHGLLPRYCIKEEGVDYCLGKWGDKTEELQEKDRVYLESGPASGFLPGTGCRTAARRASDKTHGNEVYYAVCPDKYRDYVPDHEILSDIEKGRTKRHCKDWVGGLINEYFDNMYDGEGRYCDKHLCPQLPVDVQEKIVELSSIEHMPDDVHKVHDALFEDGAKGQWSPEEVDYVCSVDDWVQSLMSTYNSLGVRGGVEPDDLEGPFDVKNMSKLWNSGDLSCDL